MGLDLMKKFGLIGYPLGHSFSEKYFTEKFKAENLDDCVYELFPVQTSITSKGEISVWFKCNHSS
jgi:shikimate 5-dehydrogenase